jgi:TatD DNase family protein
MLVDTHCHINFDSYDEDRADILARATSAGVTTIINPAVDLATSRAILKLIEEHSSMYGAVGIHPNCTADFIDTMIGEIEMMAHTPKVVAIGEIGLDYHWKESPKETQ